MDKKFDYEALKREATGLGMAIGMLLFLPVGFILSIATDNFAFIGLGLPIGVAVGAGIGNSLLQRRLREFGNESD